VLREVLRAEGWLLRSEGCRLEFLLDEHGFGFGFRFHLGENYVHMNKYNTTQPTYKHHIPDNSTGVPWEEG